VQIDRRYEIQVRGPHHGLDRMICLMQFGDIPHEAVLESIELFGKHVIPHFAGR